MSYKSDCLFCEEDNPCAVHADKPKKQRPRKPTGSSLSASIPTPTPITSSSTQDDWVPALIEPKVHFSATETILTEDQLMFREMLRNLLPLLSAQDKVIYKEIMESPKSAAMMLRRTEVRRMLHGTLE